MKHEGIRKLYYSISEVAEMTGLEPHVLRYWETEFEELQPKKNRAGNRVYTDRDIEMVRRIQHLLREDKYTLEGARQVLAREADADGGAAPDRELLELRAFLEKLLRRLDAAG
ncbi:MAG: MerR family transcriptional regulator [Rhodothermales bacterium]|nr:MerR family transcriptional regulator [Rhodothermales bacterium]